jgi:hypothetical protein
MWRMSGFKGLVNIAHGTVKLVLLVLGGLVLVGATGISKSAGDRVKVVTLRISQ